jgi:hypothetical protein
VVLAVVEGDPHVDHRVAGQQAVLHRLADALLDRADELVGDGAAEDLVDELEAAAAGQRLHLDVADAVLAVAAGLLDVAAEGLGGGLERLLVGEQQRDLGHLDAVLALQPLQGDLDVVLAHAPQDGLMGVDVALHPQGEVLGLHAGQAGGELLLVAA